MRRADQLLEGLDPSQRAAVTDHRRPLVIVGGPGSGKTQVLATRVAWRVVTGEADPARTLVIAFSRRAAAELRGHLRLRGLNGPGSPTVSTLHALAASSLQRAWREAGEKPMGIASTPLRLLAPLVEAHPGPVPNPRVVAAEVVWAKARDIAPDAYPAAATRAKRLCGFSPEALMSVAAVFAAYEADKAQRQVLDIEDLVPALMARLAADSRLAARLQWHHRHLYVDEFQDFGRAALGLVRALAGPGENGQQPDLTVVGDPDQSVYGFLGSDPRLLLRLAEVLPGTASVRLSRAYRTPPAVLAAARAILTGDPTDRTLVLAEAVRSPTERAVVEAAGYGSAAEEGAAVAEALQRSHRAGRPWSDLAVLARTNGRLGAVAAACEAVGVPTRSRRGLLDRPEVQAAVDTLLLRRLSLPADACREMLQQAAAEAAGDPQLTDSARRGLQGLTSLAGEYSTGIGGTLGGFLAWLEATVRAEGGEPPEWDDAVDLLTFHRAKGLEWDIVHIVGFEEGTVPIRTVVGPTRAQERQAAYSGASRDSSAQRQALSEERRLAYVAFTRALEAVRCTWVRSPSQWLAGALEAADALKDDGSLTTRTGPTTSELRAIQRVAVAGPLLGALRHWRDHQALALRLAPAAVLEDVLLERIAEHRPANLTELAAVPGIGPARALALGPSLLSAISHLAA